MNELHSSLYAAALLACLAMIPMARALVRDPHRLFWLTIFLMLQSLSFLLEWLMLHPDTPAKALWLGLLMSLAFLLAPCLWLCARELTQPESRRWRDLSRGQMLVIAAGVALVLPLFATTHGGTRFIPDEEVPLPWHGQLVHEGMIAAIGLFGLQGAFYLRQCQRLLVAQAKQAKALFSNLEDQALNTLRALILILGMHCIVGVARGLHGLVLGREAGPSLIFALCQAVIVFWAVLTLPRVSAPAEPGEASTREAATAGKYARSALDEAARTRIRRKLDDAFQQRQLHRDCRLNLRKLCEDLRESPHYVSQVINQNIQLSFYDLVNRHRVLDAMTILGRQQDIPLSEVALAVGFNSKSTFNAAFRQHAGTTPSDFRRAQRSEPAGSDA
jgi:AraC-like DNA-binding protein